jgi:hypothetical protein
MKNKSPIIIEDDNSKNNYLYKIIKWLLDSIKSFFKLGCGCLITIFIIIPLIFYFLDFINIIINPFQFIFDYFNQWF